MSMIINPCASLTLFTDERDCAVQEIFHAHGHDSRATGSFLLIPQSDEHLRWPLNPGLVEANHLLHLLTGCLLTLNHLERVKKTSVKPLLLTRKNCVVKYVWFYRQNLFFQALVNFEILAYFANTFKCLFNHSSLSICICRFKL